MLADSHVFVISSRMEGGANALSEAIVVGVPVLASRIKGNVGILGQDYQGLFRVGDTQGLSKLMWRAEADPQFLRSLQQSVRGLATRFNPKSERAAWSLLLTELQNSF